MEVLGRSDDTGRRSGDRVAYRPGNRFIEVAIDILAETGRTDFTVQQLVSRAKASLRGFYQHFANKDELLIALSGDIIASSAHTWRAEVNDLDATEALRLVIDRVGMPPASDAQHGINRALSLYYEHLAQVRPKDFAELLLPLHALIRDILERGAAEGVVSTEMTSDAGAAVVMQTILGTQRMQSLGVQLTGTPVDTAMVHAFCMHGLTRT